MCILNESIMKSSVDAAVKKGGHAAFILYNTRDLLSTEVVELFSGVSKTLTSWKKRDLGRQ
jgi:hypothetical protein